jgi:hypothetical protein
MSPRTCCRLLQVMAAMAAVYGESADDIVVPVSEALKTTLRFLPEAMKLSRMALARWVLQPVCAACFFQAVIAAYVQPWLPECDHGGCSNRVRSRASVRACARACVLCLGCAAASFAGLVCMRCLKVLAAHCGMPYPVQTRAEQLHLQLAVTAAMLLLVAVSPAVFWYLQP